jgi:hypothetical protein
MRRGKEQRQVGVAVAPTAVARGKKSCDPDDSYAEDKSAFGSERCCLLAFRFYLHSLVRYNTPQCRAPSPPSTPQLQRYRQELPNHHRRQIKHVAPDGEAARTRHLLVPNGDRAGHEEVLRRVLKRVHGKVLPVSNDPAGERLLVSWATNPLREQAMAGHSRGLGEQPVDVRPPTHEL